MRRGTLTDKQNEVLNALYEFIKKEGLPPSYRDLMKIVNLKSSSTIKGHLDRLKEKGFITWEPGLPRTLKIVRQNKTAS
ncbi:transcriptional regulator [Metabacillus idriensis]|uniref:LexA family protein n=1 Tax=Metabacillus idriensis TaxID=324768 RepID=UPI00174D222C|nr:transcriptional regulator [Metabacillus idriensis]MCM3599024.1 transcriptional regulator [Metabacillus idriensis]